LLFLAIPSRRPKTGGGNRQQAEAELVYINMERCNFFREKIEALKCFSKNPHALTWCENELTRF
jgi:hypothetical protein